MEGKTLRFGIEGAWLTAFVRQQVFSEGNSKKAMGKLKRHEEEGIENALYDSKEECQKICDELNDKQGHPEWIYKMDGTPIVGEVEQNDLKAVL